MADDYDTGRDNRDEIYSKRVPAGRRTYFFDVKTTRSGEDFFITTKLWASDHGTDNTNAAIDQSLEALQTDYIDLLLLHGPDNGGSSAEEKIELRQQSWVAMEALDSGTRSYWDNSGVP